MENRLLDLSNINGQKSEPVPEYKKAPRGRGIAFDGRLGSKDIIQALFIRFYNHRYMINNAYIFDWESDFFSVTESDYIYEFEIKVSKSDFKDDFNKVGKHVLLESAEDPQIDIKRPNKFYYVTPRGLLNSYEIPIYAGLIEVISPKEEAILVKDAPFLHKEKILDIYKDKLLEKFAWRYRDELLKKYESDMNSLVDQK